MFQNCAKDSLKVVVGNFQKLLRVRLVEMNMNKKNFRIRKNDIRIIAASFSLTTNKQHVASIYVISTPG